jgi:hypothetical protein
MSPFSRYYHMIFVCFASVFSLARSFQTSFRLSEIAKTELKLSSRFQDAAVSNFLKEQRSRDHVSVPISVLNSNPFISFESILSANKRMKRTHFRWAWTFLIAPTLTVASLAGTGLSAVLTMLKHQNAEIPPVIECLLNAAQGAMILHLICGGICFGIARTKALNSPLSCGLKGFVSGFIVVSDLLEVENMGEE